MSRHAPDIRIRLYQPDDVDRLYEAARESVADMQPWMPWCHEDYCMQDAESGVERQCHQRTSGERYSFVVEDSDGRFLGGCGLNHLNHIHRTANLGYWLRTSARGRGVMIHAVKLLRDYAFDESEFDRLEIKVAVGNLSSHRVAERVGAVREGVIRQVLCAGSDESGTTPRCTRY